MRIDMPSRRPRGESIIPMINVVFLLLIFFLLTAQVSPPTPFEVTPPDSSSELPSLEQDVLYISAKGELAYNDARGDAIWVVLGVRETLEPLEIRADGAASATRIAEVLKKLRGVSETGAQLVVSGG